MPKVSVIIPVYKVEPFIERCARSLFEQTLEDIEYLFIDDCTPDQSIDILEHTLEDYPQRKSQVTIHRMEHNSGQAKVREWGMKNATGEYVIHCDSDDWLDTLAYEKVYDIAKTSNADIVFFDYYISKDIHTHRIVHKKLNLSNKERILGKMLIGYTNASPLWSALVKRTVYKDNILYPKCNQMEDKAIMYQCIYQAKKMIYYPHCLYYYYDNPQSICRVKGDSFDLLRWQNRKDNYELIYEFNRQNNINLFGAVSCCKYIIRKSCPLKESDLLYPEVSKFSLLFNRWFWYLWLTSVYKKIFE